MNDPHTPATLVLDLIDTYTARKAEHRMREYYGCSDPDCDCVSRDHLWALAVLERAARAELVNPLSKA